MDNDNSEPDRVVLPQHYAMDTAGNFDASGPMAVAHEFKNLQIRNKSAPSFSKGSGGSNSMSVTEPSSFPGIGNRNSNRVDKNSRRATAVQSRHTPSNRIETINHHPPTRGNEGDREGKNHADLSKELILMLAKKQKAQKGQGLSKYREAKERLSNQKPRQAEEQQQRD